MVSFPSALFSSLTYVLRVLKNFLYFSYFILDVPIVRLKTLNRDKQVSDLLNMFGLPSIDYTKGYQSKPRPELTGGSAIIEDRKLKAIKRTTPMD